MNHNDLLEKMGDPEIKAKILSEKSLIKSELIQDMPKLMGQVFPLGDNPNYEPEFKDSIAGIAEAQGLDVMEV